MSTARVQARGQVTVPHEIREACGVEPGTDLYFVKTARHTFECRVLPPPRPMLETIERYTVDGVAPDLAQLRDEMGQMMADEQFGTGQHVEEPADE